MSSTYGWTEGTVSAQNAPTRLRGLTGASIQRSSKKRPTSCPRSGEKDEYESSTIARACPRDTPLVARGDRHHAVVFREPVDAEQPGLDAVPATRHLVALLHRVDEHLDRLVARLVGEVAALDPARVAAQPVVDRLV